jgi:heptosyltransferase-2
VDGIKPLPMQDYYLEICRNMGLTIAENPAPKLYLTPELELHGDELLAKYRIAKNDRVIGLNPGASFGSSKCWPVEHFASLAERLQKQYQCKILLFIGPGEEPIADAIVAASKADLINTAPDKIDLAELKPLIKRCDLLVTNDTGPRHYAVSLNVPNVVIMGPTNPVYTESNLETTAVIRKDLPCSPCHKKVCPLQHHECMTTITPADVCEQIEKLLPEQTACETLALS